MSDPNSSKLSRSSRMPKDLKASIRGQLKHYAQTHGEDMLYVLSRYALERLLYRIGCSPFMPNNLSSKGRFCFYFGKSTRIDQHATWICWGLGLTTPTASNRFLPIFAHSPSWTTMVWCSSKRQYT